MSTLSGLLRIRRGAGNEIVSLPGQLPTYGSGIVRLFFANTTFTVPSDVTIMRGRVAGTGKSTTTASIGSIISATGGGPSATATGATGGIGIGGDFNANGGKGGDASGIFGGGGGAAGSELGNGGNGGDASGAGPTGPGGGGGGVGGGNGGLLAAGLSPALARLGGPAASSTDTIATLQNMFAVPFPFHSFTGLRGAAGTVSVAPGSGGPGGGGGAAYPGTTNALAVAGNGGIGGGGGGANSDSWPRGLGGIGGGDGGLWGKGGNGGGGYSRRTFGVTPGASLVLTVPDGAIIILEY